MCNLYNNFNLQCDCKAKETADRYMAAKANGGQPRVMGACWCGTKVFGVAKKALEAVAAAESRDGIKALGPKYKLLQDHLLGQRYKNNKTLVKPAKSRSGRPGKSGWVPWRGSAEPGSARWPSGKRNLHSVKQR